MGSLPDALQGLCMRGRGGLPCCWWWRIIETAHHIHSAAISPCHPCHPMQCHQRPLMQPPSHLTLMDPPCLLCPPHSSLDLPLLWCPTLITSSRVLEFPPYYMSCTTPKADNAMKRKMMMMLLHYLPKRIHQHNSRFVPDGNDVGCLGANYCPPSCSCTGTIVRI